MLILEEMLETIQDTCFQIERLERQSNSYKSFLFVFFLASPELFLMWPGNPVVYSNGRGHGLQLQHSGPSITGNVPLAESQGKILFFRSNLSLAL